MAGAHVGPCVKGRTLLSVGIPPLNLFGEPGNIIPLPASARPILGKQAPDPAGGHRWT
ncbi:hypothetical protein GCM10010381_53790 [Streptomyces xantholiticus]|nr:hypothetical protein GCM10010381_53790 [Streptomyces xantholiticus]